MQSARRCAVAPLLALSLGVLAALSGAPLRADDPAAAVAQGRVIAEPEAVLPERGRVAPINSSRARSSTARRSSISPGDRRTGT